MAGPLSGIRVIGWTLWQQGPIAAAYLGDLGAEIIKIEDRVAGDPMRGIMTMTRTMTGVTPSRANWMFDILNRNGKSVAIDLRKEEGKQIVYRLIEQSDVFLQNYRQGAAERLGLDYRTLSRYNPKLIYANLSGLGAEGPERDVPLFDYVAVARAGIMNTVGEPGMPPQGVTGYIGDRMGGMIAAYGVLAALLARDRLGVGQEVDTSVFGALLALQGQNVDATIALGQPFPRHDRRRAGNPLYNHYCCADGRWLVLALAQADRHWHDFCVAVGIQELEHDPKFENMEVRAGNAEELISILDRRFATKPRDEWLSILSKARDFACGPVNTMDDVLHDPQALANDYIIEYDHPAQGKTKAWGFPMRLSETPLAVQRAAPEFGQHTEEVLAEVLGYGWEEIVSLREREVI